MGMWRTLGKILSLALLALATVFAILPSAGWGAYLVNTPPFYTQPYLVSLEPRNSMLICWPTSEKTTESYVEFGLDEGYSQTARAETCEIKDFKTTGSPGVYNAAIPVYQ